MFLGHHNHVEKNTTKTSEVFSRCSAGFVFLAILLLPSLSVAYDWSEPPVLLRVSPDRISSSTAIPRQVTFVGENIDPYNNQVLVHFTGTDPVPGQLIGNSSVLVDPPAETRTGPVYLSFDRLDEHDNVIEVETNPVHLMVVTERTLAYTKVA